MVSLQDIFDLLKDIELRIERIEASLDGDDSCVEGEDQSWDCQN